MTTNHDDAGGEIIGLTTETYDVTLRNPRTGRIFPGQLPDVVVWNWYATINAIGLDQAHQMAVALGTQLIREFTRQQGPFVLALPWQQQTDAYEWLEAVKAYGDQYKDKKTVALTVSYELLARGDWKRGQAARFAKNLLGRNIDETTWQKAVDKWAKQQGKPALQLLPGRPRQKIPQTD